jgi:F420-non-reducing hydrogenase small subunit
MSKPKVGFYWCASCGGCEESVVDLAEDILGVVEAVDFVFFPVAMDFKREDVEALDDGEIAACFINGAIRTSEHREMAALLRRKSSLLIAYGSCSHQGGVPSLGNLCTRADVMRFVYHDSPSTDNPEGAEPTPHTTVPEGELEIPTFDERVLALDQVVEVDYYVPGCAPPTALLKAAIDAVLAGELPPRGSVLAPDVALCRDCPRLDSKPQGPLIKAFRRPWEVDIDEETCLLAQGLVCLGPATRGGCDHVCIRANMPCTGCMGPVSRVRDQGAAAIGAIASLIDADTEQEIDRILEGIPDPAGTFFRYGTSHAWTELSVHASADHGGP